jgi:iron(III) transport system substrate-binding protein
MQVNKVWKDEGKSDQEIADIWKGIASNSVVASGHTFQGELLGAGEFDIALGLYTRTVDRDSKDGVPVAYRRPDNSTVGPNVYIYDGAALLKRAPHPAASLLLIDYLLTEGQKVLADSGWPTAIPQDDRIAGIDLVQIDPEEYFGNAAKWQKEYEAVIAGHEVIGG